MTSQRRILVVDDEPVARESLAAWLGEDGYTVVTAASGGEALERADENEFIAAFVDLKMPGGLDGLQTLRALRERRPDMAVVIVTAFATVDTALTALKDGATDYLVKPFNLEAISLLVRRIIRMRALERENRALRKRLARRYTFQDIVSKNSRMHEIFELIRAVASMRSTVLIEGESGTGKELVARAIHTSGERASAPFVGVSCGALAETLLESEMFGHEKGAFTGALSQKKGKFELAAGGTIFLDEIGDISAKLQVDLLRVLQEKSFFRVGGVAEIHVDVRIIAATNSHLQDLVRDQKFREDLYYRLNVISIRVPPLRERREDIPLLANHFLERFAIELGKDVSSLDDRAVSLLMDYPWPGNVRQLENAIERAVATCHAEILGEHDFRFLAAELDGQSSWAFPGNLPLREVEQRAISATLTRAGGNIQEAARVLGIDRSTLYEKIKRYGLKR